MTDSDPTCPICATEIESTRKVGEVTYVLEPCGHQVDDHVYEDLVED